MERIGFFGLGIMGRPMAKNLLAKGCDLTVSNASRACAELCELGARACAPEVFGQSCDIVFLSLPSGEICRSSLFDKNGLADSLKPGSLVADTSSITPVEAREFADKLSARGIAYIDCPVSGGEPGAVNGTLSFMAGARQEDFDRAYPYFMMMGASAVRVGEVGSGSLCKLANQIIVNMTIASVSEAMVLAAKGGADPQKVFEAIRGGLAGSAVLEAKVPMMLARNFRPGGKISINRKDIKNVLSTAHELDVPVPLSAQLFEIMQALKVDGHMDDDHSGIVQYFEKLAGAEVRSGGGER